MSKVTQKSVIDTTKRMEMVNVEVYFQKARQFRKIKWTKDE